jgi:cytochrome c oxidase assembly factor CtaG
MSGRSRPARTRSAVEHQRLLYFTLGVLLWGFALLTGAQIFTTAVPLSAVFVAAVAGAVLTTLGIADRRDGGLLRVSDVAVLDVALVVVLASSALAFLLVGEPVPAVALGLPAAAIGLGGFFTRFA